MNLRSLLTAAVCAGALALPGCATNPVTGKTDVVTMSAAQEAEIGRKMHPQILQQYGRYEDEALQAYVNDVGQRIAKVSHLPNLQFTFTVLDSPEINAFALPGGYVYITRGIMAYLNSEAQLVAVLGHEVGHVTARHAVRQQTGATAAGVGATVIWPTSPTWPARRWCAAMAATWSSRPTRSAPSTSGAWATSRRP
jgi:predicted Zn-dependent protease